MTKNKKSFITLTPDPGRPAAPSSPCCRSGCTGRSDSSEKNNYFIIDCPIRQRTHTAYSRGGVSLKPIIYTSGLLWQNQSLANIFTNSIAHSGKLHLLVLTVILTSELGVVVTRLNFLHNLSGTNKLERLHWQAFPA